MVLPDSRQNIIDRIRSVAVNTSGKFIGYALIEKSEALQAQAAEDTQVILNAATRAKYRSGARPLKNPMKNRR